LQDNKINLDTRPVPSRHLTELIGRALLDRELCDRLFANPETIARAFDLPAAEAEAIRRLDRWAFEAAVVRLRWA
jgi:hypothetical protein